MVDDAGRDLRGGVARLDLPVPRCQGVPAVAEASNLCLADCALLPGGGRDAVVGRAVGYTALRGRPDREAADAAGAVVSFRALGAGHAGVHRIPLLLCCVAGDVVDRRDRSTAGT